MKKIIKSIFSFFEKVYVFFCRRISAQKSFLFLNRYDVETGSRCELQRCIMERNYFKISGSGNKITADNAKMTGCKISMHGCDNCIAISEGVILSNSIITIRGNGNSVFIGTNSTFGGVRIVNVGTGNKIDIGQGCLFADKIEIWASDTHPIYNDKNKIINAERPIRIGDNVWVGSNVSILKGVVVGNGAIIGMGTVVASDVEERCVVVNDLALKTIKKDVDWKLFYD